MGGPVAPLPRRVLVANRGEIAVRICRTLRALGVGAVAVCSDADADAPHVRAADAAVRIGPAEPRASYLRADRLVEAAVRTDCDALHPGYGFLSESPELARACASAGVVWVGPPPEAIELMGDKQAAKQAMRAADVPVVPGVELAEADVDDAERLAAAGEQVGYPLLVKAAAGGGGKGMRAVRAADELADAVAAARREAAGAFGDQRLLLERLIDRPRHLEVQVLFDGHGDGVALGERECSLQRRHQKVVEEAPSPVADDADRERLERLAIQAAAACNYVGAGTVELVVDGTSRTGSLQAHFLEMNTRLQVEHPVTEQVRGLDLVEAQLRVAAGARLADLDLGSREPDGHAVEARVYAEDPAAGFLPTGGTVLTWRPPSGEGVRVDHGLADGLEVGTQYDPLLAKVIAHGPDRATAIARLRRALADTVLLGVTTNLGYLGELLDHPRVADGDLDTALAEQVAAEHAERHADGPPQQVLQLAALARLASWQRPDPAPFDLADGWRPGEPAWTLRRLTAGRRTADVRVRGTPQACEVAVDDAAPSRARVGRLVDGAVWAEIDGVRHTAHVRLAPNAVHLAHDGRTWLLAEEAGLEAARTAGQAAGDGRVVAPMPGSITDVAVAEGQRVRAGQTLVVVEAMKMEHPLTAPHDGVVASLDVAAGEQVAMEQPVAVVDRDDAGGAEG